MASRTDVQCLSYGLRRVIEPADRNGVKIGFIGCGIDHRQAIELIKGYTEEPEVGKIYLGTVARTVDFGAFVTIKPGTDGLCHISELAEGRVRSTEDVVKEGDEVLVKVIGIDRQGKIKLSRAQALAEQGTPAEA